MKQRLRQRLPALCGRVLMLVLMSLSAFTLHAQNAVSQARDSLMDRMPGEWVMEGTIDKKPVTHDVHVDWILNRGYIRIHEVSREKDADGQLSYEAWIHIAWDPANREYAVMWLDNTGITNFAAEGVGHGMPQGDRIPFVWKSKDGSGLLNTFSYDRARDTWSWAIDNVDKSGGASPFARVTLRRKKPGES